MVLLPKLNHCPREIIYSPVYASFQHDLSAIKAMTVIGFNSVLWFQRLLVHGGHL